MERTTPAHDRRSSGTIWHGVATCDDGTFTGKLHRLRSGRSPSGYGLQRREYAAACGLRVTAGLPASTRVTADLCARCYPGHSQPAPEPGPTILYVAMLSVHHEGDYLVGVADTVAAAKRLGEDRYHDEVTTEHSWVEQPYGPLDFDTDDRLDRVVAKRTLKYGADLEIHAAQLVQA